MAKDYRPRLLNSAEIAQYEREYGITRKPQRSIRKTRRELRVTDNGYELVEETIVIEER